MSDAKKVSRAASVRWLIACDESGVGGMPYYGFGSLWMKWERRGDFSAGFRSITEKHGYRGECKWNKANNRRHLPFYRELIEYFFLRRWLAFHCVVFRKAVVDKAMHDGDFDLARRKHLTMLVAKKIAACVVAHPHEESAFRIWVDPIASRYRKADEALAVISNNLLAQALADVRPVESVITRDSKATPAIQLCDLLLGAVMEAWQQRSSSACKAELQRWIAHHLGWLDLRADTWPSERKFNIWYFHDLRRRQREVGTRRVVLKYPLPPRRSGSPRQALAGNGRSP